MHGTRIYSGGAEDHHGNRMELMEDLVGDEWEINGIYLLVVNLGLLENAPFTWMMFPV